MSPEQAQGERTNDPLRDSSARPWHGNAPAQPGRSIPGVRSTYPSGYRAVHSRCRAARPSAACTRGGEAGGDRVQPGWRAPGQPHGHRRGVDMEPGNRETGDEKEDRGGGGLAYGPFLVGEISANSTLRAATQPDSRPMARACWPPPGRTPSSDSGAVTVAPRRNCWATVRVSPVWRFLPMVGVWRRAAAN